MADNRLCHKCPTPSMCLSDGCTSTRIANGACSVCARFTCDGACCVSPREREDGLTAADALFAVLSGGVAGMAFIIIVEFCRSLGWIG